MFLRLEFRYFEPASPPPPLSHPARALQQPRMSVAPCTADGQDSNSDAMRVSFAVPYRCEFGQHIALVGSDEYLGQWDAQRGVPMNWTHGDVWTVDLDLPPM